MVKEKEKLVWLGVKRPSQTQSTVETEIKILQQNIGEYQNFQDDLDDENVSDYSSFDSYLTGVAGFTSSEADNFISKIQNNFASYTDFEDYVENQTDTYQEFKAGFSSESTFGSELETTSGDKAAGMRVFENAGKTKDGIDAPAGAVEIFGREVHFSQTNDVKDQTGSGSTGNDSLFTVDNFTIAPSDTVAPGSVVDISADVTNNGSYVEFYVASLTEDGEVIDSQNFQIGPGSTRTVTFEVVKSEYVCHDYAIDTTSEETVCWAPAGL